MIRRAIIALFFFAISCVAASALTASQQPSSFPIPWANSASCGTSYTSNCYVAAVPTASQIGIVNCAASLTDGFPPLTFIPVSAGGCGPFGQDLNGILKQLSQWSQWYNAFGALPYSSAFQTSVGGYPSGAIVASVAFPGVLWRSTADSNTSNPDTGGGNWTLSSLPPAIYSASGAGNAQTATIPGILNLSALQGRLIQYTPAVTNIGPATLAISGLAAENVMKEAISNGVQSLQALSGGELQAGKVAVVLWDGTEYVLTNPFPVRSALVTGQVYFEYVSPTSVILVPHGGSSFVINGAEYQIPAGGVTAANTNIFVNGVANQSLGASALYDVFLFNNGGTLTLDFWSTSSGIHETDTTAGNVGIEVRNAGGGTPDSTRSYVGKVETNASGQFQQQGVGTISWYNRKVLAFWGNDTFLTYNTSSLTPVELSTSERGYFITFGDSAVISNLAGQAWTSGANTTAQLWAGLDGSQQVGFQTTVTATVGTTITVPGFLSPSEGEHYLTPMGNATSGGTAYFGDLQFYISNQG